MRRVFAKGGHHPPRPAQHLQDNPAGRVRVATPHGLPVLVCTRVRGMGATITDQSRIEINTAPKNLAKQLDIAAAKKRDDAKAVEEKKKEARRKRAQAARDQADKTRRRTVTARESAVDMAQARRKLDEKRKANEKKRAKAAFADDKENADDDA